MKKALLFLITIVLFLCSCTSNKDTSYDPHKNDIPTYKINRQDTEDMAKDILTYFDNRDRDSIKALFAQKVADTQIDKVFEIYDGTSVSYELGTAGEGAKHRKDRMVLYLDFDCELKDIKTDNDKTFRIYIQRCIVDDDNSYNIGLKKINLCGADGTKLAPIGEFSEKEYFKWEY